MVKSCVLFDLYSCSFYDFVEDFTNVSQCDVVKFILFTVIDAIFASGVFL